MIVCVCWTEIRERPIEWGTTFSKPTRRDGGSRDGLGNCSVALVVDGQRSTSPGWFDKAGSRSLTSSRGRSEPILRIWPLGATVKQHRAIGGRGMVKH